MKPCRGRRGVVPLMLNLGTGWGVSGQLRALAALTSGKKHFAHRIAGLVGPKDAVDVLKKRLISCLCRIGNPGSSSHVVWWPLCLSVCPCQLSVVMWYSRCVWTVRYEGSSFSCVTCSLVNYLCVGKSAASFFTVEEYCPEDGRSILLRNVGMYMPNYTPQHLTIQ
jgi:hypothetical protein